MKIIVKYGGSAMGRSADSSRLFDEIAGLIRDGHQIVLVHGGGPEIDSALAAASVETLRIDGLRVTDSRTLNIAEAVLCGTLNKRLVRECLQHGLNAVGVSGQDGTLLKAKPASVSSGADLGYVGEISSVDSTLLNTLLHGGFVPVVAPIAVSADFSHAFNVNADTSAGAIAAALRADALVFLTDVPRVLRDPANGLSGIDSMTAAQAHLFARSSGCQNSMRPKVLAAANGVEGTASRAFICSAESSGIKKALAGDATVVTG